MSSSNEGRPGVAVRLALHHENGTVAGSRAVDLAELLVRVALGVDNVRRGCITQPDGRQLARDLEAG